MMEFEFLRPLLLLLIIPWAILTMVQVLNKSRSNKSGLIAPHLAHAMLTEGKSSKQANPWLLALFTLLCIIFIAGPSFEKQEVPVFKSKQARVVVMDMSYSMFSTDIKPDRLTQARFKALDMVELFKEGETALVAYAGDAFTVSPLTSDASTLSNLIPSLSPEIMPSKGSNVYAGIDQAMQLLSQAGYLQGEIILITDGLEQSDVDEVREAMQSSKFTLSIYAIGTAQGAPIALPEGGFMKGRSGEIVIPRLNVAPLRNLAAISGGQFSAYTPGAEDIQVFAPTASSSEADQNDEENKILWRIDAGKYGLILLIPLALLLLRKSALVLCAMFFMLPLSQPVYAADWQSWFKNTDQNALSAYQSKEFEKAAVADNTDLKGAALYKQGQYEQAAAALKNSPTAIGQYNYGNALAQLGKLDEAIAAYEQALKQNPDFDQAKENKALLEQMKQQQEQQQQNQSQDGENNQDQQSGEQSDQQGQSNKSEQGQQDQQKGESGEQSDQQQGEQSEQDAEQQNSGQQNSDQQNKPDMQADAQQQQNQAEQKDGEQSEQQAQPQPQQATESNEQQGQQPMMQSAQAKPMTPEEKEKAQQLNQLLRKVPDDPAILLRNKMRLEAQKRAQQRRLGGSKQSW